MYPQKGYRGFKSLSLRHFYWVFRWFKLVLKRQKHLNRVKNFKAQNVHRTRKSKCLPASIQQKQKGNFPFKNLAPVNNNICTSLFLLLDIFRIFFFETIIFCFYVNRILIFSLLFVIYMLSLKLNIFVWR